MIRKLTNKTETILIDLLFLETDQGIELEYSDLQVSVKVCPADPSIGQPEHIDEMYVVSGKLAIMEPNGNEIFTLNLSSLQNTIPTGMVREFNEALEELVWEAIEDYDND